MKNLAQVFIAMAEAGVRLQSDGDSDASRCQRDTDGWQTAQSERSRADTAHGPDQKRASVTE